MEALALESLKTQRIGSEVGRLAGRKQHRETACGDRPFESVAIEARPLLMNGDGGNRRAGGGSSGELRRNIPHDQQSENREQRKGAMEPADSTLAEAQITIELHISLLKDDSTPARVGWRMNYQSSLQI